MFKEVHDKLKAPDRVKGPFDDFYLDEIKKDASDIKIRRRLVIEADEHSEFMVEYNLTKFNLLRMINQAKRALIKIDGTVKESTSLISILKKVLLEYIRRR